MGDKTYGAFNWGDTRFVLLDCGEDKTDDHWVYYGLNDFSGFRDEQTEFLRRELHSKAFRQAGKMLTRKGDMLKLKVLDTKGHILQELEL